MQRSQENTMGKESLFNKLLGKLDSHMQRNETEPLFDTMRKINLKWSKDLNVRPEIIKVLRRKHRQ